MERISVKEMRRKLEMAERSYTVEPMKEAKISISVEDQKRFFENMSDKGETFESHGLQCLILPFHRSVQMGMHT